MTQLCRSKDLVILLILVGGGILLSYRYGIWLAWAFLPGLVYLLFWAKQAKIENREILAAMTQGLQSVKGILILLILISMIIPCWMAAGIVAYLVQLGLHWLSPSYFLTGAFLLTSAVALLLGTSTGSLSAVGVPLMGIGALLGVPPAMTGGAVISGAFFGDRTSPVASANQLVASFSGIAMCQQMKALMPTTLLALTGTLYWFVFLDQQGNWQIQSLAQVSSSSGYSYFGAALLIPPGLLLAALLLRRGILVAFILALVSAWFVGVFFEDIALEQWYDYILNGFHDASHALIMEGKGFWSMLPLLLFIFVSGIFNGLLDRTKLLQPYMEKIITPTLAGSTTRLGAFGFIMDALCCNQTMPILLTAASVRPIWIKAYDLDQMARIISDTALVVAGLIPWNLFALICANIIGVSIEDYSLYAAFLWMLPAATLLWSYCCQRIRPNLILRQSFFKSYNNHKL